MNLQLYTVLLNVLKTEGDITTKVISCDVLAVSKEDAEKEAIKLAKEKGFIVINATKIKIK